MCVSKVSRSSASCFPACCPRATSTVHSDAFGGELFEIAIDNVFGRLWTREGLSRRDRSLVTLGILIALRSSDELKIHVQIARNNGLTEDEIAEVIYHSSGYAGLPAANSACKLAREVFDAQP